MCERDQETRETREKEIRERDKREKTGIKSVRLEDCFRLHRNQQHYINFWGAGGGGEGGGRGRIWPTPPSQRVQSR